LPNEIKDEDANVVSNVESEKGMNSSIATNADRNVIGSAVVDLIVATMPNPQRRGYFGPRNERPPQQIF